MAIDTGAVLEERYEVNRALRSGGMGAVYLATDRRLARTPCAIKEILEHRLAGSDADYLKARFQQEMAALATLDHPGIPRVRDYFQLGQSFYIVMDYIDGPSLDHELAESLAVTGRPLEPEVVAATSVQVLEILAYLHNHRPPIIHRDVKPSNLLREIRTGRVKLVDFGLAKEVDQTSSQTMVGTPGYCAIEQMHGKAEPRSDLYSLGVTMHHLLTGQSPRVLNLSPLREAMPDYRPDLAAIVERATSQHASDRYPNAEAMLADLRRWLQGESSRNGVAQPLARVEQPGQFASNGQAREASLPARMLYSEVAPSTQTMVTPQTPAWVWASGMLATLLLGILGSRMMMPLATDPGPSPAPPVAGASTVVLEATPTERSQSEGSTSAPRGSSQAPRTQAPRSPGQDSRSSPPPSRPPARTSSGDRTQARPERSRPASPRFGEGANYPVYVRKTRPTRQETVALPAEQPAADSTTLAGDFPAPVQAPAPRGAIQRMDIHQFKATFGVRWSMPGGDLHADLRGGPMAMSSEDGQFWAQALAFTYPGPPAQAVLAVRRDAASILEQTWFAGGQVQSHDITRLARGMWVPMQSPGCYGGVYLRFKEQQGTTGMLALVLKSHISVQDARRRLPLLERAFIL